MKFTLTEVHILPLSDWWKSLIAHVQDHYWETDGLQMELLEEFILSLEGDSDSESDVTSSENDSDSDSD